MYIVSLYVYIPLYTLLYSYELDINIYFYQLLFITNVFKFYIIFFKKIENKIYILFFFLNY